MAEIEDFNLRDLEDDTHEMHLMHAAAEEGCGAKKLENP